jgi:hypothetical protein
MPFDPRSVPDFKIQEITLGPVEVVLENDAYALYNNGIQWMVYSPLTNQEIKELYSSYDLAYGDVLLTGLGFGILALWLCNKPEVKSVTVVEKFSEVIEIFKKINDIPDNLTIINDDASMFATDKKYDVLLLDHYETQNFDWRLRDMQKVCDAIKHDVFWAWSLDEAYMFKTYKLDKYALHSAIENYQHFLDIENMTSGWKDFVKKYFPNEKSLLDIDDRQLEDYIYGHYNKSLIEFRAKNNSRGEL